MEGGSGNRWKRAGSYASPAEAKPCLVPDHHVPGLRIAVGDRLQETAAQRRADRGEEPELRQAKDGSAEAAHFGSGVPAAAELTLAANGAVC